MPVQWACHRTGQGGDSDEQLPALRLDRPPSARPEGQRIEGVGAASDAKPACAFAERAQATTAKKTQRLPREKSVHAALVHIFRSSAWE
jgi:hypothetical protein